MKEKPIIFKDGKKVDMSSVNDQWIDGDILGEEMEYVSRMTEGLTTGTMTDDKEYVILKNKVVKEMIDEKVITLKKRLCEKAKKKSGIYDQAKMINDKILTGYQEYARQVAKDSSIEIYFNELTGDYKINKMTSPISLKPNGANSRSYKWHTIDAKILKEAIKSRGEGIGESKTKHKFDVINKRILKEVEEKMNKFEEIVIDVKKKTTKKKAVKKTMKKKITKKKAKKKNDK